jgi:hypothetical protein
MQLDEGREAQAKPRLICLGEYLAKDRVEHKPGFEVGAGRSEFDVANPFPQIQPFRPFSCGIEQPVQAAAKVCRLAEIRLGLRVFAAQQKYGWRRGNGVENLGAIFGHELDPLGQHKVILV